MIHLLLTDYKQSMVYSEADKGTIINCFTEKGWRGHKICCEFPNKKWNRRTVNRIIGNYEQTGTTDRKVGSGRPASASTEQNTNNLLRLTESQEEEPGSSISLRKAAEEVGISKSTAGRISQNAKRKSVKRIMTPQMNPGAIHRRYERSRNLYSRYDNERVKRLVWQDKKDWTIQVPINSQNNRCFIRGKKAETNPARLYHPRNKFSKKLMTSCVVSWNGVSMPFFVNPAKTKINARFYTDHLENELIPAINEMYPHGDAIFVQDGASSHTSNLCQNYLAKKFGRDGFVNKNQWPPHSPELNPLDYYFWDAVQVKVYEGRREPFTSVEELQARIEDVWVTAVDGDALRRAILQFRHRLHAIVKNAGGPIKHLYK